ncbi:MAG: NUDIX hydrolase [Alphaproteobacteria bacterium]|nr:NUDIX hydrolase [Alphaproteobacteria bacterium]
MSKHGTTPTGPGEYRDDRAKAVRPREAATLIVVRQDKQPKILMGKRAASHKFMPNKFVFPGGRLDLIDQRVNVPKGLSAPVMKRLRKDIRKDVSDNKLRGLALAAIRETYEETGLIIGRKSTKKLTTGDKVWQSYFDHGVEPPLDKMDFIARAVTPTYRTRRFDTRFFMVYDEFIHSDPEEMAKASGELLDLHWLTLPAARKLDLPAITRSVIDMVETRMTHERKAQLKKPAPYVRFINGKSLITEL